ncbi:MAG: DNA polymerase III subunit alpha [Patescibacteria group bacterium]
MEFQHLHVHSHFSLLNGLTKIKPLVKGFKDRGFKAATLTDGGSLYGAIKFYQTCEEEGIKPIIGFEAYLGPRDLSQKDEELDKEIYQLVLIAENYDGYRNLMKLSSIGHLQGFFQGKPRIDKKILKENSKGIICLSGNIKGEISQLLLKDKTEEAKKVAKEFNEIFGQNNFFLELNDHPALSGQVDVNNKMIKISRELNIPLVVSRDVYYLNLEDAEAQDILVCIRDGLKVDSFDREDLRHVDRSLNKAEDIESRFRHVSDAIENTVKIRDRVNLKLELDKWHFAPVDLLPGKDADETLREMVFFRIKNFFPEYKENIEKTKQIEERIEYELNIIKTKGYSPYFICVADFVNYAKSHGIVETTRGSGAGSLVSYIMGITTVDPLRFKLPFERFLNPFRPSPPDIDTDFADDRRDDMIEYVTKKYGEEKVAQIITFGTMAARGSVRDVGRVLGFSYSFCDQVSKLIPMGSQGFPMTIKRALEEEPDLKKLYNSNADVKKLLDLAQKVEGCARHTSIHAAGVVIAPTPLVEFSPVQRETGGTRITTQYEMKSVEAAGVLKNDFLGIRNLSILGNAVEIVEKTTGEKVNIYTLPLDDKKTFDMLARGETMGVFQLSGSGMTRWLKELKPNRIEDIMAMVALYRPGPMESIPEYIKRKYNPEAVKYFDPRLEKILDASYGLLVYQDDVMLTAIELAGYDWMEADKFRKAMGKKIPEEMAKQKEKFYDGCKNHGQIKKEIIDEMWHAIEPFAAYGFNKAHAASYGIVAYQTAYMKAHYPVQYMAAVLAAESGDNDKIAMIVGECRRMEIEVLAPDINESFKSFAMVSKPGEKGRIRFGLSAVKNVGEHICEVIYRERKNNGPYKNLEDFLERVEDKDLNKKSLESLIKVGALTCFNIDRGILLANIENLLNFIRQKKEKKLTNQNSLFFGTSISLDSKVVLKDSALATLDDKLKWEKELIGIYVSSHPFTYYENIFKDKITKIIDVENYKRDDWIVIGGVVDKLSKKITKKGSIMMFATLLDETGRVEMLVFPKTYEETKSAWVEGNILCVIGKTPKETGDNKIFVEKVYVLNKNNAGEVVKFLSVAQNKEYKKIDKYIELFLSQNELKDKADKLKEILAANPGENDIYIKVENSVIKLNFKVARGEKLENELKNLFSEIKINLVN